MYHKYNEALKKESGVDFQQYVLSLRKAGNESGIYADVALLLYKLVSSSHTKSVLEFGSGMSTCILAKAAADHNKKYNSMEHLQVWYDITLKCLNSLGLKADGYVCTNSLHANFSKIDSPVDLAFVDGPIAHTPNGTPHHDQTVGRIEACEMYSEYLQDAVLVFDDAQSIPDIPTWLLKFGRSEELQVWFNPTGRIDRHQLISFPNLNHPLRDVVDSCRL